MLDGWVRASQLCLSSKDFFSFASRIRKLGTIHPTVLGVKLQVAPFSSEFSTSLYPIFPRVALSMSSVEAFSIPEISNIVTDVHSVLIEMSKIIDEFRDRDKGFQGLRKLWEKALSSMDKNEKGKLLEEFLSLLIAKGMNFGILDRNLRTESEEIDIVAENNGMSRFYSQLNSPIVLFECKNWSSKIGSKEIRDFAQKIQNRPRFLCRIGIVVTISGLTSDARKELLGYRGRDYMVAILETKDIEVVLKEQLPLGEILKVAIRKAGFR